MHLPDITSCLYHITTDTYFLHVLQFDLLLQISFFGIALFADIIKNLVTKLIFVRHTHEGGEQVTDFQEVYNLYFRDVYRYALSLCRNELVAEEITQETFYKALDKLGSFDGKCKVSVWLCQIAKNTYISMCRKDKHLDPCADTTLIPCVGSIEDRFCDQETAFAIHKVLHTLEEPYKEVFSLRTFGELSFKQIAELFGRTETWARVTYHRARLKIKEELK